MRKGPRRRYLVPLLGTCLAIAIIVNISYFALLGSTPVSPHHAQQQQSSRATEGAQQQQQLENSHSERHLISDIIAAGRRGVSAAARARRGGSSGALDDPLAGNSWPTRHPTATLLCTDVEADCGDRRKKGMCLGNTSVTLGACKASCQACDALASQVTASTGVETVTVTTRLECADADEGCDQFAGLCAAANQDLAIAHCKATCRLCESDAVSSGPPAVADSGQATAEAAASSCRDHVDLCPLWAGPRGLCIQHSWMYHLCKKSCGACVVPGVQLNLAELRHVRKVGECTDYHPQCSAWAAQGVCGNNYGFMSMHCAKSCQSCQAASEKLAARLEDAEHIQLGVSHLGKPAVATFAVVQPPAPPAGQAVQAGQVVADGAGAARACADLHANCPSWAATGECLKNAAYMHEQCALSCRDCTQLGGRVMAPNAFEWLPTPLAQVRLNNGLLMPAVGFGSAGLGDATETAVAAALRAGYRHIDTAEATEWYREDMVGKAVAQSGVPRGELFLTSKLHPKHHGYYTAMTQFEGSLKALGTEYLDLFLLHYPECFVGLEGCQGVVPEGSWIDSWRALQELYGLGKVRAIGVSNFNLVQLAELLAIAVIKPAVLQVHMDPLASALDLRLWCSTYGVQVVGYSTLGTQWGGGAADHPGNPVLTNTIVADVAKKLNRSVSQVVLRWALQLGVLVIPRSANEAHMAQNLQVWDFQLDESDMKMIATVSATA